MSEPKSERFIDRHFGIKIGFVLASGCIAVMSTIFSALPRARAGQRSYAGFTFVNGTRGWHWGIALALTTLAWAMVVYKRREVTLRTSSNAGLLNFATLVGFCTWAWFFVAVFALPFLQRPGQVTQGRPFRLRGRARLPRPRFGRSRSAGVDNDGLSVRERDAIGRHWLECARGEYASVPAFRQLAVRLHALEAPQRLIDRALQSAAEERVHAERTLALASRMLHRSITLSFDESHGFVAPQTIAELAVESLIDGCLNEGCAAREAALRADAVRDIEVAAVLRMIAHDEAAHAELAWDIIQWALQIAPREVGEALQRAVLPPARTGFRLPRHCDHDTLRSYGWIDPAICVQAHSDMERGIRDRLTALIDMQMSVART